MFCTGCGTPIQPHDHFCHHCGKQMHLVDFGQPPHRKRTAPWVIVTGIFVLFLLFYFTWSTLSYQNLETPVRNQLTSIRVGKIPEAYYEYTSKQFQSATSLDQFKQFINSHDVLKNNKSATFESPLIEETRGLLRGILYSTGGEEAPIQYLLERQDEEWKILNMQLSAVTDAPQAAKAEVATSEADELYKPIDEQLTELKEGKDEEAYNTVSQGFKNATNLNQFNEFVKRYPVLKEHTGHAFKENAIEGDRAAVRVDLLRGNETLPVEYHLVKENNAWKIWSLQVIVPQAEAPDASLMAEPVQNQLKALKEKEIKKAYDENVADEFKRITPYATFEAFVQKFKIFTDYTKADYQEPKLEQSGGKVVVTLSNDKDKATVEYTLGVEEGKWKIWGFSLLEYTEDGKEKITPQANIPADFNEDTLKPIIQEQLQSIKDQDLDKAYDTYTASQFKEATTKEVFKEFIKSYPIFYDYTTVEFGKLRINNNIATITSLLVDSAGAKVPVEYDFILDGNDWKILRMQVLTSEDANATSENLPYYPKIVIGTEMNPEGAVTKEVTEITDPKNNIYANIYVNGKKGETVSVVFKHNESNSAIPPVTSSALPQDGVFRTSFSFNPPPQGWPKGSYTLDITSSTGHEQVYNFEVK